MQDAHPISTRRKVPRVSANSITKNSTFVTSSRPTKSFAPGQNEEEEEEGEREREKENNAYYVVERLSIATFCW